ncbi:coiled-coil domain-containing protein mad1 [Thoreauomyces humboldtii]|nr:coiled-coil domain-containing protein mad1 [Thoreauomyces humboldtii]
MLTARADEKALLDLKCHDLETRNVEKETKVQESIARINQLETDRQFLLGRNKELSQRWEDLKEDAIQGKEDADIAQNEFCRQISELQDCIAKTERTVDLRRRKTQFASDHAQGVISELKHNLEAATIQIEQQADLIKAGREQLGLFERRCDEAERVIRDLQADTSGRQETATLRRQLVEQTAHIQQLEIKQQEASQYIQHLRNTHENAERLKDDKHRLEQQLLHLSSTQSRAEELEVEVNALKTEKMRWTEFLTDHDDVGADSPYTLCKALAQHRLELAELKAKLGEEEAGRAGREVHLSRLENELRDWRAKASETERQRQNEARSLKRLDQSRALAQKEVDFLREQLKSYAIEEEHLSPANYDADKAVRIANLEASVDEYRKHVLALEEELRHLPAASSDGVRDIRELSGLEAEATKLRQKNAALQADADRLDTKVGDLERALGRGEYNVLTTRVLELADNPERREAAIRQSTLDALRSENQKLIEQIGRTASMEVGIARQSTPSLVPMESLQTSELECVNLRRDVEEKEKRVSRLKGVYAEKVSEYREAVFCLLGYKLDLEMDGRVRLTSMYAGEQVPTMVFCSGEGDQGTLELVGGGGEPETRLRACMAYYVDQLGSVPAFLAGVTLELLKRGGGHLQS